MKNGFRRLAPNPVPSVVTAQKSRKSQKTGTLSACATRTTTCRGKAFFYDTQLYSPTAPVTAGGERSPLKILLVSPNRLKIPSPVYPIGLDYVAGAIPARHQVSIFDLNSEPDTATLGTRLTEFVPDLVGIALRNIDNTDGSDSRSFIADYHEVINIVRANSRAPIVLGGSGFTIFPETLMDMLDADYGIPGDGERIASLIEALENGQDATSVPGILTRGRPMTAKTEHPCFPIRRKFDARSPHLDFYLKHSSMMNVQTKRGCPFHCIYCTYPHIDGNRLRLHDPEEVAETALALQRAGARYFFISDSTFNCSVPHSIAVAKAISRAGVTIPWGAFFAPLAAPTDYFRIMAGAGLRHVEFGTESLCDRMLATYRKPFRKKDVRLAHQRAIDAGLHVAHYLMPGGPGETLETLTETLETAESLMKTVFFFFCGIRIYPHTELHSIALSEGKISADQNLLTPLFYEPDGLSRQTIEETVRNHAADRPNWITGSGDKHVERALSAMYAKGFVGPLWEHAIP